PIRRINAINHNDLNNLMNKKTETQNHHLKTITLGSELLDYLIQHNGDLEGRIPSLGELSNELHVSVSKLREQLEVARQLGLVSVRPRTGIHRQPYSFMPAVRLGLFYALATNIVLFDDYHHLRLQIEISYWHAAVSLLTPEDKQGLLSLIDRAWDKLRGTPIRIPHHEHREFHMAIFSRLENVFVRGLLEAYWEAYEAVELHTYADYGYLKEVWEYHELIARRIVDGDVEGSLQAYIE
ncbi:MAG: hypothetical protein CUN55_16790, partial [Phototrophicales bacterium]